MVNTISEILKITKEEDLLQEFEDFEQAFNSSLQALVIKLDMSLTSTDTVQVQNHMCFVESWRDRVSRYNALIKAFVEHGKSSHFSLGAGKVADREAHTKKLTAGFLGLQVRSEELIRCIDSRVNVAKVLLRIESSNANLGYK